MTMNAEKAREIVQRLGQLHPCLSDPSKTTLGVRLNELCEWTMATTYLECLEGAEVSLLLEGLKMIAITGCECETDDPDGLAEFDQRCKPHQAQDTINAFRKAVKP